MRVVPTRAFVATAIIYLAAGFVLYVIEFGPVHGIVAFVAGGIGATVCIWLESQ